MVARVSGLGIPLMSRTQYIEFRERGFWTYDVAFSVLAKHFIDAAAVHPSAGEPWLADVIERVRNAAVCNYGVKFDAAMSTEQLAVVIELLTRACASLSSRDEIPGSEIASWSIGGDPSSPIRIETRGHSAIRTRHVVHVGEAIVGLLSGTLPEGMSGHGWLYGVDEVPVVMR